MTKLGRAGIGVIVLGTAPFVSMELWGLSQQHAWYPLSTPISLQEGEIRSPAFTVKPSLSYRVMISFSRTIDLDRMDCLLRLELPGEEGKCGGIPEADDIRWTVLTRGRVIAAGSSRDSRWGEYSDRVAKVIGEFDATERAPYRVVLEVRQDASALDKTNPHLEVLAFDNAWDTAAILTQLSFYAMFLFGALGTFLIFLSRGLQRKTIRLGLTP